VSTKVNESRTVGERNGGRAGAQRSLDKRQSRLAATIGCLEIMNNTPRSWKGLCGIQGAVPLTHLILVRYFPPTVLFDDHLLFFNRTTNIDPVISIASQRMISNTTVRYYTSRPTPFEDGHHHHFRDPAAKVVFVSKYGDSKIYGEYMYYRVSAWHLSKYMFVPVRGERLHSLTHAAPESQKSSSQWSPNATCSTSGST
jgi:hypothetical protein